jgi:hypothetical protein
MKHTKILMLGAGLAGTIDPRRSAASARRRSRMRPSLHPQMEKQDRPARR